MDQNRNENPVPVKKPQLPQKLYWLAIILILVAAVAVAAVWAGTRPAEKARMPESVPAPVQPTPQVIVKEVEVEKILPVEKEITAQMLEEGLQNIGLLISQTYDFKEVISYSNSIQFPLSNVDIPFTESGYIVSYEGTVSAGVDFAAITLEKNMEDASITVHLPKAKIISTEIDTGSFTVYDQKNSIFNPLKVEEFNEGLAALEQNAQKCAKEKGLLDRANEHAGQLVKGFLQSAGGTDGYRIYISPKYT